MNLPKTIYVPSSDSDYTWHEKGFLLAKPEAEDGQYELDDAETEERFAVYEFKGWVLLKEETTRSLLPEKKK